MAIFGGEDEFSWTCDQLESCRQWSNLSKYAFSAKSLEPFSRKWPKTLKNGYFWHKIAYKKKLSFFGKTAVNGSCPYSYEPSCKKSRKSLEPFLRKTGY